MDALHITISSTDGGYTATADEFPEITVTRGSPSAAFDELIMILDEEHGVQRLSEYGGTTIPISGSVLDKELTPEELEKFKAFMADY